MGKLAQSFRRFPLLLKFLNAREMLSVQVHPGYTRGGLAPAAGAKTEAWVVLEAGNESRIYAGLHPGTTTEILEQSLANGSLAEHLSCITPKPGGGVFIPAGTVHSLGDGIVVFEIQQNNDVTFRLYDWGHVDAKTKQPRPLQVEQALACIDFADSEAGLVTAVVEAEAPVRRERLFHCDPFWLWRLSGKIPFTVGAESVPRVLVCTAGTGQLEHSGSSYVVGKGEVWLLPAEAGKCAFRPHGAVTLLEIAIPDQGVNGQGRVTFQGPRKDSA
jgi:mannose-6-phosphate isomerase